MSLADKHGKQLYELRPDVFPPFLSDLEVMLWGRYFDQQAERRAARG